MELKRDYMWDNMKGILIFLVVVGHMLESNTLQLQFAKDFDFWIYTFHMPAFIFASGFWAKRYCLNGKVKGEKTGVLIAYYLIFQFLITGYKMLIGIDCNISIFESVRGLWYIFALILYYLMIPVFEKLPAYITIPGFIILGVLIGNDLSAGTYFSIHRTFVFAPFFFAGYYMSGDFVNKLQNFKFRIPIGILAIIASISIWLFQRDLFSRKLFYGKANFTELELRVRSGIPLRLTSYLIASLMILCLILVMPKCKTFLSHIGKNSLQIYIFHLPLIIALFDTDFLNFIQIDSPTKFIILLLISAAVTFILSINIFSYPFKWIQTLVNKAYSLKDELKH